MSARAALRSLETGGYRFALDGRGEITYRVNPLNPCHPRSIPSDEQEYIFALPLGSRNRHRSHEITQTDSAQPLHHNPARCSNPPTRPSCSPTAGR